MYYIPQNHQNNLGCPHPMLKVNAYVAIITIAVGISYIASWSNIHTGHVIHQFITFITLIVLKMVRTDGTVYLITIRFMSSRILQSCTIRVKHALTANYIQNCMHVYNYCLCLYTTKVTATGLAQYKGVQN